MIRSIIGTTERRVALALLVTAVAPLLTAMWLANTIVQRISSTAFQPEFSEHLDRSLELYRDLAKAMKMGMRHEASYISSYSALRASAKNGDRAAAKKALAWVAEHHRNLLSIEMEDVDGQLLASFHRDKPLDERRERAFAVRRPLGDDGSVSVVFAADRSRFNEIGEAHEFAQAYKALEKKHRGEWVDRPYLTVFAVLFCVTVLLAVLTGVAVVRPSTKRIRSLAAATGPVAQGDLSVRVDAKGYDEIAELARAFNHMLERLDRGRARIEFLKRIGEWQNMARRLAHEIKNPLTPIQLAVEECQQRYRGDDEAYREMLLITRDIVTEEVASLRRLVGEFAAFARLPRASLRRADLAEFMRQQVPRLERELPDTAREVSLSFEIPDEEMRAAIDRTMLHRVLANLVTNAAQATGNNDQRGDGVVEVRAYRDGESFVVDVDDDGPGVATVLHTAVFDPYVTTKKDGTGLGLTIVKKVVMDHGGDIDVHRSPLGGARFRIRLPAGGTKASEAALSQSQLAPLSG